MPRRMIRVRDSIRLPGGAVNDDIWGARDDAAWILDGATGLSQQKIFTQAGSDALWFVTAVGDALQAASPDIPVADLLAHVSSTVKDRFFLEANDVPEAAHLWPTASFAAVRLNETGADLINLGDCRIIYRDRQSRRTVGFGSSAVGGLEQQLTKEIERLQARGIVEPSEIWTRLLPQLSRNRELMNRPEGYWILDVLGKGIAHTQYTTVPHELADGFLLMTDGFYRLVDNYRQFTAGSLFDAVQSKGLAALGDKLRDVEASDPKNLRFPRIKTRDDATAVFVEIVNA